MIFWTQETKEYYFEKEENPEDIPFIENQVFKNQLEMYLLSQS